MGFKKMEKRTHNTLEDCLYYSSFALLAGPGPKVQHLVPQILV
jgi:hypothetical protein